MPPLPLAKILQVALPSLAGEARAVVEVLACKNGLLPHAGDVATFVGLRTRHQVARTLRRASLPPLEELAGWTRLFYWVLQAERTGASLLSLARESHLEPATCYRLVRRLMGEPWSRVRRAGIAGAILRFRASYQSSRMSALALQPYWRAAEQREVAGAIAIRVGHAPTFGVRAPPSFVPAMVRALETSTRPRGTLSARLELSGYPFDVVIAADGTAWLTRVHAAVLERLQGRPFRSTGAIHVGVAPTRIALAPTRAGNRAWVTNQFTRDVAVVDLAGGRRIGSIAMEGNPLATVLSPDGRLLYVSTNLDRLCVCAVTDSGGRVVRSAAIPQACVELTMHPSGNRLFVPTWKVGSILEVDAHSLAIMHRHNVGGAPLGTAISRDGMRLYSANEEGWVDLVHVQNGKVVRRNLEASATELALSPDERLVYVSMRTSGRVAILDADSLNRVGSLETGGLPRHIAFDRLGSLAIIANEAGWVDLVR